MLFPQCPAKYPQLIQQPDIRQFDMVLPLPGSRYVISPMSGKKSGKVQAPDIRQFSLIFPFPGSRYVISPMSGKISAISSPAGYPAI